MTLTLPKRKEPKANSSRRKGGSEPEMVPERRQVRGRGGGMATQRYKIRQRDGGLNCGKSYCNFARSCDDTRSGSDGWRDRDSGRSYYQAVGRVQRRQENGGGKEGAGRGAWALRDAHDTRLLRRISFLTSIVARDLTK